MILELEDSQTYPVCTWKSLPRNEGEALPSRGHSLWTSRYNPEVAATQRCRCTRAMGTRMSQLSKRVRVENHRGQACVRLGHEFTPW